MFISFEFFKAVFGKFDQFYISNNRKWKILFIIWLFWKWFIALKVKITYGIKKLRTSKHVLYHKWLYNFYDMM